MKRTLALRNQVRELSVSISGTVGAGRSEKPNYQVPLPQRSRTILTDLAARLATRTTPLAGLNEVLRSAINLHRADFGNIQILDPRSNVLKIVAQVNFMDDFLDTFRDVSVHDDSACGRAMRNGAPVVVEDVLTEPSFQPFRAVAIKAGYRSVQSTPIFGPAGEVLGMISTHFIRACGPSADDLRTAELCAAHASRFAAQIALHAR